MNNHVQSLPDLVRCLSSAQARVRTPDLLPPPHLKAETALCKVSSSWVVITRSSVGAPQCTQYTPAPDRDK
jgi:hypothetical protein